VARYILKGDKRAFPDNPRPNSLTNVWQATYTEVPTLPPGGTTGQVLAKETNQDYDVHWITLLTNYLSNANNGLSLSGLIVQLGGVLIKNTTINGGGLTYSLTLEELENLIANGTFLDFDFSDSIQLSSDTIRFVATNSLDLATPAVIATTATVGQVLKLTNATTGKAEWADETTYSGNYEVVINPTSPYTIVTSKELVIMDTTSGNKEVKLKTSPTEGDEVVIKKLGDVNNFQLTAGAGHTVDGASGAVLTLKNQSLTVVFDGVSMWVVTSKYL